MAQKMDQIAKNMQQGNQQQAQQQMQQMAQQLQEMQQEVDEMQALDEMMDQLADARESMNGMDEMDGMGGFGQQEGMPGMGMGEGQGRGDRPEEKTDSRFYDSKVRAKLGKGKMIVTGSVAGPNKPGEALEAIKEAMAAAETAEENPLTNVRMPKAQLEQAQQYFDAVRQGPEE